jgi:hypothetical protein
MMDALAVSKELDEAMGRELVELEDALGELEASLPPPPPQMFVIPPASAESRALPLFFANHHLLSFANEELEKAFFQFHGGEEDDEDRMTPDHEADAAAQSSLAVVDRAFAVLRMKRPPFLPKKPSKPLAAPGPGALRFTV